MKWWQRIWRALRHWCFHRSPTLQTVQVIELPDVLDEQSLYLVGEGGYLWYAALLCPCHCGEIIYLNLLPEQRPRWQLLSDEDVYVTLEPSVWRQKGCRSHFFIRGGEIIWCEAEQPYPRTC